MAGAGRWKQYRKSWVKPPSPPSSKPKSGRASRNKHVTPSRPPTMSSGQFWFPFMKHDEIIDAFSEWGLTVSEHALRNPTPDMVKTVYITCLQNVSGLNDHALQPAVQRALQQTENPVRDIGCI